LCIAAVFCRAAIWPAKSGMSKWKEIAMRAAAE